MSTNSCPRVEGLEPRVLLSAAVFDAVAMYAAGNSPYSVATADFNGDGRADLAVSDYSISGVAVLMNVGNWTFAPAVFYGTGSVTRALTTADFNNDGRPDIAVTNYSANTVTVFLNQGGGVFGPKTSYATGLDPQSVAAADFNGDGWVDLVTANYTANTVSVLLNAGNGTFLPKADVNVGSAPQTVIAADLNADGHPDVATANVGGNGVSVLQNIGGSFLAHADYATGSQAYSLAAGDFNSDGKNDLAVTNSSGTGISVLFNAGAGLFGSKADYATPVAPYGILATDLNGDGKTDIAVGDCGAATLNVFLNTGTGTFGPRTDYAIGKFSYSLATADFNNDGRPDLAVSNYYSDTVSVLLNLGSGAFSTKVDYASGLDPQAVVAADLNHDGHTDLAAANLLGFSISVFLNNGDGTFAAKADYDTGPRPSSIAAADFNGDGWNDLVVTNSGMDINGYVNTVSVFINNGNGTFAPKVDYATGQEPYSVAVADFDHDGKLDLAVADAGTNLVSVLPGNGDGTFGGKTDYTVGTAPFSIVAADFDGDGWADVAVANEGTGNGVSVLINNEAGGFAAKADYATGTTPYSLVAADFTGDGRPDLAVSYYNTGNVSVFLNSGTGAFAAKTDYPTGSDTEYAIAAADFSGDGKADLVVINDGAYTVSVLLNNGSGMFASRLDWLTDAEPRAVAAGDFDGDGRADIATANYTFGSVSVLMNLPPVAPVVTPTATALDYYQAGGWTTLDPALTLTDPDSAKIWSATVSITGNYDAGKDVLAFTNQHGITGSYNSSTGVLTLSGRATVAYYQTALESITYRNASTTASALARTISYQANDGTQDSPVATRTVNFHPDVAPVVTTTGTPLDYHQVGGPAAVDAGVTATDADSANLVSAAVWISANYAAGQDALAFTNQNGIAGSWNASTGTMTLTGSSSAANYQAAIESILYGNASAAPSALQRTVSFKVNDGLLDSNTATRAIDFTADVAPVVSTTSAPLNYLQVNGWAAIDTGVTASDADGGNLVGATVWISGNFAGPEDVLGFVNQNGITGSYNSATGVMTLAGASSVANYQAALRTVAYANTGAPPSALQRTFSFKVNDGLMDSNTSGRAANFTADAVPVVTTTATPLKYVDGDGWLVLDGGATATDADSANLTSATVWVSANYVNGQDVLGFTNQNGITGSWNAAAGALTLTGSASVANYQTALRSIGYYWVTASGTPAARTISFQVSDSLRTSATATRTVNISKLTADAYEYNDASWITTPVTLNDSGVGGLANATIFAATGADTDWYRFTVPYGATGDVAVTVGNVGGGLKAHIGLYDSILGTLADQVPSLATLYGPKAQIDGSTANGTVTLNYSGLAAGSTWYIKVTGLTSTHGVYDLGVTTAMMSPDALEANNTSGVATNATTTLVSGSGACCYTSLSLHRSNDEDWFRIDTPANTDGNLVATVSHLTAGLQGLVWVYQHYTWGDVPMGIGVYASWTPGGAGTATIYNAQPNTTYFIRVDNFWAETGGYQLDVTLPLDAEAKDAFESGAGNNASWLAHPLTLSSNFVTINDLTIHNSQDLDWYSFMPTVDGGFQFDVNATGNLVTHLGLYESPLGTLADQYGGVFNDLFGAKRTRDASGPNMPTSILYTLHAWHTYYFKVSGLTGTTGQYQLHAVFAPTGSAGDIVPDAALLL